ncbi:MAG: hypothetical protein ACP5KV_07800, partial [Candidatus Methanomethylicaceae archaeon]
MLEDRSVRRWYENIARGSKATADVYLRRLGNACERLKIAPSQLARMGEGDLYDLLLDYISLLEREGKAGSYIAAVVKALRSWLAHNGIRTSRKIKIRGATDSPTLRGERVPTQEELRRIFLSGDKKARAACALMAFSGLRIEVLGNYSGTDGLRIGDLPEMRIEVEPEDQRNQKEDERKGGEEKGRGEGDGNGPEERGEGEEGERGRGEGLVQARGPVQEDQKGVCSRCSVTFERIPTMVVVRRELSKAGHQYFTFLGREGCEYLKDYLEERMRQGERLTPDSPVITPKSSKKRFIRSNNIGNAIRTALRRAGFPWRPYVLRSYFDTQLMLAESKGLIIRDYRQFFMGHKGDIENRYTTNKCRLPEGVIGDMRAAYERCAEYLETGMGERRRASEQELKAAFRR